MDRFTNSRLRDEAIRRAQDRASLRKPTRTFAGSPLRGVPASLDQGLREQSELPDMALGATSRLSDQEGSM